MKIAIHCADLDNPDVNGTRTYMAEVLKGMISSHPEVQFYLYHKATFNPVFEIPVNADNVIDRPIGQFPLWTQTRFAFALFADQPDVIWMPIHNLPRLRRKSLKNVVTIHDIAWKYFPETFTPDTLFRIEKHTRYALVHADQIITVSYASKKDIAKFYPDTEMDKVSVTHLGTSFINKDRATQSEISEAQKKYNITGDYLICIAAIQPRKNFITAIEAFEKLRETSIDLKLVIVGPDAWNAKGTHARASESSYAGDIIFTGGVSPSDKWALLCGAKVFVCPSLYEGFGIVVLEAFAAGVPAVVANNSSLTEVAGDGALLFDAQLANDAAGQIANVITDAKLYTDMISRGNMQVKKFSWDQAAEKTFENLTNIK